ncbi:hypothetical protein [Silvanigrella aquatica]|uniref:LepB N-terminal domain-containing protein n=1 Tax=Silvanigrella aquatica TaxID=1915309 RepID=A0A1L4D1K4_9BACT|nr:hypothetical protein [Silvanigrella aquatica]APJ04082.1 hypothetical protein AXG55_09250 [Silvanigrella aquatica]
MSFLFYGNRLADETEFKDFPKDISCYKSIGGKSSGANTSGIATGVYAVNVKGKEYKVLFKQGRNDAESICEFLAHKIYELIIPGYSSKTILAFEEESSKSKFDYSNRHKNIYVGSVFFENFMETHKLIGFKERPFFLQTLHNKKISLFIDMYKDKYNLEKVIATALWLGDYDVHIGNIGSAIINNKTSIVKIDHGWSFAQLQDYPSRKKTPWAFLNGIGKPTNHFNDYNVNGFYSSPSFKRAIEEIKSIDRVTIENTLTKAFYNVYPFYQNNKIFKSLCNWIGCPSSNLTGALIVEYIVRKLIRRKLTLNQ